MAEIEKERKRSKKSKSKKPSENTEAAVDNTSNEDTLASEQLKALVQAAQIEWQMADGGGIEFTEEVTDKESAADEAQAMAELSGEANEVNGLDASEDSELLGEAGAESNEEPSEELNASEMASEIEMSDAEGEAEENQLDSTEEAVEFIEADQAVSIIESLLFSSDKPVSLGTFKQVFKGTNIKSKDITRALDGLASEYANQKRGVTIEEINGGYQLRTKSDNAEYLRRLSKTRPFKLSGPALEVLSIIAYKQPCVKAELDEIRGVESGHLLRALMERGLCSFAGKSELPGKPMLYQTTRKFLEIFGLRNLRELPTLSEIDELIPEGIGDEPEKKEKLSDITGALSKEIGGNYSEGEEDLLKITDQLQQINTSSDFFEQEKVRQREKREFERAQNIREALTVGEAVDSKDQKWLARYEAKLAEASIQAEAAATGDQIVSASEAGFEPMGEEATMEALVTVEESLEEASETAEHSDNVSSESYSEETDVEMMADDSDETDSSDDLSAMPDWDEEK